MFGIALAVDYSLFILMRFREELRAGRQPSEAVDAAMATSGLAVVLSGMTVVASLTGIYLINTPALKSMATGAILAVAVAMLTSATLTPAALATFGRSAAKRSALLHWSRAAGEQPVAVLDPLGRVGDAPAVDVGAGGVGRPARHGGTGGLDGAGQQPAAPVRLVARDPCRGGRGGAGARARARWARFRCWSRFPTAGASSPDHGQTHRRDPPADGAGSQHRLGGDRRNSPTTTAAPCCPRCCRSTPRTCVPARPSTGCARSCPRCREPRAPHRWTSAARPR